MGNAWSYTEPTMQTINISSFRTNCLSLLDNLGPEGILITKHGRPIALITPASSSCADLIGSMQDKIKIHGDIFSTSENWLAAGRKRR
jgi:antitoxin (DNA-binding transcriptional repressor) of toxin-antitoxin stability system